MGTFRHTRDNDIFINNTYVPLSFFVTLYPAYALPAGSVAREYEQTVNHAIYDDSTAIGGAMPYVDGDTYIAAEVAIAAAYALFLNPIPTLAVAKTTRITAMEAYAQNIRTGGAIANGYIWHSGSDVAQERLHQYEAFNRAAALPTGFYINDNNYNQITIGADTEIADIADAIVDLDRIIGLIADSHRTAINALVTVAAVQAYNFTTGWPITPGTASVSFYATYAANINGVRGGGVLAGTAIGGAAIAASYLDLAHADARYVDYAAHLNADSQQTGTIVFYNVPNYNGAPALDKVLFSICKADADPINLIQLHHDADQHIYLAINDSGGASIAVIDFGVWTPVAASEYKFTLRYDITAGATRLFINNAQQGATNTATGVRDANITLLRIGGYYDSGAPVVSDFSIRELVIYS